MWSGYPPSPTRIGLRHRAVAERGKNRVVTEERGAADRTPPVRARFRSPARHPVRALDQKAMQLSAQDQELRAALFRLVDVTPATRSLDDLARHLTRVPRRGGRPARRRSRPPCGWPTPRPGRRALGAAAAGGVKHMAHRFIVGESPRAALPVLRACGTTASPSTVDLLGEATVTEEEADRYAARCAEALEQLADATAGWPRAAAARVGLRRAAAAREPVGEGLGAHAAAAPGRARAAAATTPRAGCGRCCGARASSAPTCTSTWSRSTRSRPRSSWRSSCWPRRSSATGRRPAWCSRPTCATRRPRSGACSTGRASHAARPAAHGAAGQGRLLGPRGGRGAPARLVAAGVRGQGRLRPQLRGAHPRAARRGRAGAGGGGLAQPALGVARDRATRDERDLELQVLRGLGRRAGRGARRERAARAQPTARWATSWPAWRTWCGGCSRTPPTSRSSGEQQRGTPVEELLAAP